MMSFARVLWRRGCLIACLVATVSSLVRPINASELTNTSVHYLARTWQADEGLPDNNVQAVVQTRDRYLWVGTGKGLARFDGVTFTTFTPQNTSELRNAVVTSICEDNEGSLWIGTEGGGLTELKDGVFHHFDLPGNQRANSVRTIFCTGGGLLLVGTMDGIFQYQNCVWIRYGQQNDSRLRVVRAICEYKGQLCIGTGAGIAVFEQGVSVTNRPLATTLGEVSVRALLADSKGNLWVGVAGGLWVLHSGQWRQFSQTLADINISTLREDRHGEVWIGTFGGLNRFSNGRILTEKDSAGNFYDNVHALEQDEEGNIWVGANDGLHQLRPSRINTITRQQGLPHNHVVSIIQDQKDGLWAGTWGGGIAHLNNEGTVDFIPKHSSADWPSARFGLGLCVSHDGVLYFGTDYDGGVFCYKNGETTHFWKHNNSGLNDEVFRTVYEDTENNLWFGSGDGLILWNTKQKYLPGYVIRCLMEDRGKHLWVGTSNGLYRRDKDTFIGLTTKDGLCANEISAIYQDATDNIWIGTSAGLSRFNSGHFSKFTTARSLWNDDIFAIVEDNHGWLWMSCAKGIFRVNKDNLLRAETDPKEQITCIVYGKEDGMLTANCSGVAQPSACKSRDGRLWFATSKGLVVINTETEFKYNDTPPAVFVEQVVSGNQVFPVNHRADAKTFSTIAPQVIIPAGNGEMELRYTALSFNAPEKNRFKYKLEGVDTEWKEAGTRRFAYYSNLRPGNYRFRVNACNNDGVWNGMGDLAVITMLPHFWQTWWFTPVMVAVIAALVWAVYRTRQNHLNAMERLRLRMASDLHDEVGSNLGSISLISRLMQQQHQSLGEEEKRDLALIHRLSAETANAIKDIVWFTNPEYDTVADLLSRMEDESRTLLVGIDCQFHSQADDLTRKLPLDFRQNLFLLLKEALANIIKHSRATKVEISISTEKDIWSLRIGDNGVGFNPQVPHRGNGLKNLRRRAAAIGGSLQIESTAGNGTQLTFTTQKPNRSRL
jgi:ligand-binding sensor domain-containing protein/two-component sensor histidine kinase